MKDVMQSVSRFLVHLAPFTLPWFLGMWLVFPIIAAPAEQLSVDSIPVEQQRTIYTACARGFPARLMHSEAKFGKGSWAAFDNAVRIHQSRLASVASQHRLDVSLVASVWAKGLRLGWEPKVTQQVPPLPSGQSVAP